MKLNKLTNSYRSLTLVIFFLGLTQFTKAQTWTGQTSGTTNHLMSVFFTSSTQGWAVGSNGTILTTTNGGVNWSPQVSGTTANFYSVHFASASQGWAVTSSA